MPHPCVVCGRSRMNPNNREEDYMFFGFPVNYEERCKKWLEFCCREDLYKLTKKQLLQRMVCSKHFERKDFLNEYQDRLNCTGVPSIYDPTQSLYNIACVLCDRYRKDPPENDYDGTTFHHFPGEEFRCLKWLDFVGIDSYYRLTRKEILYCYICSNHFERSQFMPGYRARLCDNAVPSIYIADGACQYETTQQKQHKQQLVITKATNNNAKSFQHSAVTTTTEKAKKYEPLTSAVLESQACAACGRSRSDPRNKIERYKFHPFPAYEIGRCLRWCQFLGREDLLKMSPNQIRKLVLCSKHFLSGQSFHKVGPCDAVPTIKEVTQAMEKPEVQVIESENADDEEDEENLEMRLTAIHDSARPMVSSKKPKVDNKPAPLAKKRGRRKLPTAIDIPKVDHFNVENNRVSKVPIPATNWKIQFANNQFQPLTIANTNSSGTSMAITSDGKKVILPFAGNISSLGAPIPVNSLSSIPPGFLIKINLPEQQVQQTTKPVKSARRSRRNKKNDTDLVDSTGEAKLFEPRRRTRKNRQHIDNDQHTIGGLSTNDRDESKSNVMAKEESEEIDRDVSEILDADYIDATDFYNAKDENDDDDVYEEISTKTEMTPPTNGDERVARRIKFKKGSARSTMSERTRRTLLPIRTEVRHFLHKLTPYIRRLPRKAKAQIKLSIVNLVIDRL